MTLREQIDSIQDELESARRNLFFPVTAKDLKKAADVMVKAYDLLNKIRSEFYLGGQ